MLKRLFIFLSFIALFTACQDAKLESRKALNNGIREMTNSNYEEAAIQFDKAIEIDENFAEAYLQRARLNLNLENWELVTEDLNKAISINAEFGQAYKTRALFRLQRGDKDGACEDFQKAKEFGVPNLSNYLSKCN